MGPSCPVDAFCLLLRPSRDLFAALMMSCDIILFYFACYDVISHSLVLVSSCLTAPHPSRNCLRNVFMNTSDITRLFIQLPIPYDKCKDAITAADFYYQCTEPRKVRELIYWLDCIGDTALADSVMDCAEPPAGMTHSVHVAYEYGDCWYIKMLCWDYYM